MHDKRFSKAQTTGLNSKLKIAARPTICLLAFRVLYSMHLSAPLLLWHHSTSYHAPLQSCCFEDVRMLFQHDLVFEHKSVISIFSCNSDSITQLYLHLSHSYALRSAVQNAKCICKHKKNSPKCGENSTNKLLQYNHPHLCTIWCLESMLHLFHLPEFSCLPWHESSFKSYWFSMTWCLINKPRVWISTVSISVTLIWIHL